MVGCGDVHAQYRVYKLHVVLALSAAFWWAVLLCIRATVSSAAAPAASSEGATPTSSLGIVAGAAVPKKLLSVRPRASVSGVAEGTSGSQRVL